LLVDLFIESHAKPPREIWLDLDATDDPLHGHQEGRFFHGYYCCYVSVRSLHGCTAVEFDGNLQLLLVLRRSWRDVGTVQTNPLVQVQSPPRVLVGAPPGVVEKRCHSNAILHRASTQSPLV